MGLKMSGGDYVREGAAGLARLEGQEALLGRVLFRLTARRGSFPLLPALGSRLYLLSGQSAAQRELAAKEYVIEALLDEPVTVTAVTLHPAQDGGTALTVYMDAAGESLTAALTVQ